MSRLSILSALSFWISSRTAVLCSSFWTLELIYFGLYPARRAAAEALRSIRYSLTNSSCLGVSLGFFISSPRCLFLIRFVQIRVLRRRKQPLTLNAEPRSQRLPVDLNSVVDSRFLRSAVWKWAHHVLAPSKIACLVCAASMSRYSQTASKLVSSSRCVLTHAMPLRR